MAGHSHWSGIKRKKEVVDQRRGKVFTKLASAITAAARVESDPAFNPRLRSAIEKAREAQMPAENIERAITTASDTTNALQELLFEAYGPGGAALLIEVTTDNRNLVIQQVKLLLNENGGKWAETGSVRWGFEPSYETPFTWKPQFPITLSSADFEKLSHLITVLRAHDDVHEVYTNALSS